MWETWVPSLGREDPLEKGITSLLLLELQSSFLENSMGRGACQEPQSIVSQSQTRLRNWHCFTYIYSCSCGSAGKESTCSVGDLGLIPCLGRSPGEVKDYPLQYSGLENSTDCIVHGVAKSDFYFTSFFFLLQKYIHCLFFSRNSFPEGHFFFLAWRVSMCLSQKNISSTYQVSKTEQPRCPKESLVIMGLSSATRFEWLSKKAQKTGEQR